MSNKNGFARYLLGAALAIASLMNASQSHAADDLNVRFSYKLKGEYGFFYMGQAKGLYKKEGLNVKFGEGVGSQAVLGGLLQGQDDIGIIPGIFAISAIQKGMPVKIVALYQPAAPTAIISHPENPVNTPKDLEGKTIAAPVGETGTTYLGVFCEVNKIDCSKIKKIQINVQARVVQFLANQIDAIALYTTNDLPIIEEKTGKQFPVLDQVKYGLVVPGLSVVVSNSTLEKRPDAIKKFLSATSAAIELTRKDPAGATAAIKASWPNGPSDSVVNTQIDLTSKSIPAASADKPLGWVKPKAIEDALKLLQSVDNIGTPKPASAFYTNDFLKK